ncbi:major facilitator superfamily MFS_1 [Pseudodesulfovibrio mercurii]|uniref:Major facilitator superfamily MFS_1 n=1 Tax=Pseudodesulfovibrio mercurii TaxID=641491 RepID=F0JGT5_9BACT|nr:MFS transporter [Pseudodesulfovibrio mercurii]EGB15125.1 major facilitator superfamily MFS_1 [Pseudodesulfovibrio mercurii]
MQNKAAPSRHYGWTVCLTGAAVVFACLGLGRFSLGMLLPSMGASLSLDYGRMGLISTGNFTGYMLAVLLAGTITQSLGARRTIAAGLALVGLSMVLIGRADGFEPVLLLYFATGVGSGLANVPLMGLISHWFLRDTRGRAAGIMVSGNGVAIIFAGLFIPWVNQGSGGEGWRIGWLVLGLMAVAVAVLAGWLLRNHPRDKGLEPLGGAAPASASPTGPASAARTHQPERGSQRGTMVHLGIIYLLFGATSVVYATFIVTALVDVHHYGEDAAGRFWAVVGGLSVFSGPLFGWLSDRLGRRFGMIVVFSLFTVAYAFAALNGSPLFLYASVVIFGVVAWSIPTIMSAAVGDYMGPNRAVKAFGLITLFFGAGQIIGPVVAGYLADLSGDFNAAFWLCAALTACAVVLTALLRQPE